MGVLQRSGKKIGVREENRGQTATFNKAVNDREGVGVSRSLRIEYPGALVRTTRNFEGAEADRP